MKDFISYYYNIDSFYISKDKEKYIIKHFNTYYLYEVYDLDKLYKQYRISSNIAFYYSFIVNRFNSIISKYHNKLFVLFKINNKFNKNIKFIINPLLYTVNYNCLWYYQLIKKSDFLEKNYLSIKGKYSLIDDSFDYYLGLLEMSIYYLRDFSDYVGDGYLQHVRISDSSFYNPLAIKIDIKERDFAEYLKYLFWNNKYKNVNIHDLIYKNRNNYNFLLVMARILYPNYYFDVLEQIVFFDEDVQLLKEFTYRALEFRDYYNSLLIEIRKFYNIKKISF